MTSKLEPYPGLHPGTGTNDHVHQWQRYRDGITACHICGKRKEV